MNKLTAIQDELKAPKSQYNSFGKYKYRKCEDILEAVKPLLVKHDCQLTIEDELVLIGDRYYVKAIACFKESDQENCLSITAYAREELDKKGMDASQITGAASSYARKYALNGLFLIDDTQDADSQMPEKKAPTYTETKKQMDTIPYLSVEKITNLWNIAQSKNWTKNMLSLLLKDYDIVDSKHIPIDAEPILLNIINDQNQTNEYINRTA